MDSEGNQQLNEVCKNKKHEYEEDRDMSDDTQEYSYDDVINFLAKAHHMDHDYDDYDDYKNYTEENDLDTIDYGSYRKLNNNMAHMVNAMKNMDSPCSYAEEYDQYCQHVGHVGEEPLEYNDYMDMRDHMMGSVEGEDYMEYIHFMSFLKKLMDMSGIMEAYDISKQDVSKLKYLSSQLKYPEYSALMKKLTVSSHAGEEFNTSLNKVKRLMVGTDVKVDMMKKYINVMMSLKPINVKMVEQKIHKPVTFKEFLLKEASIDQMAEKNVEKILKQTEGSVDLSAKKNMLLQKEKERLKKMRSEDPVAFQKEQSAFTKTIGA